MNKTILITGAKGNLGKASVKKFLINGYRVLAVVSNGNALGFMDDHKMLSVYELDVTNADMCKTVVERMLVEHKQIDAALLLVGTFTAGNLSATTLGDMEKMMQLNFNSAFNLSQPLLNTMKLQTNGGKLIFIGSKPGLDSKAAKDCVAYALSKSLLFRLAEIINADSKKSKVTASVIVPGTLNTEANRLAMPNADFNTWVNPDDLATAMEFLCSDNANDLRETVLKIYGNAEVM